MSQFPVGLYLPQDGKPERVIALAREAEAAGLDSVWLPDHLHQFPDKTRGRLEAWMTLAAVAAETSRIGLGLGVCNVQLRNPRLLAKMAFTVDAMSGGRLLVALGTGGNRAEIRAYGYLDLSGPQAREQLKAVVDALSVHDTGDSAPFVCNPGPAQRPFPIVIAADHVETMRLAARHADWWYANLASPDQFAGLNARMTETCASVGRDPATLKRNAHVLAIVGRTQSAAEADAATYAAQPRARLFESPHVVGDADRVRVALQAYHDAGADRACVYVLNRNDANGVALVQALGEAAAGVAR